MIDSTWRKYDSCQKDYVTNVETILHKKIMRGKQTKKGEKLAMPSFWLRGIDISCWFYCHSVVIVHECTSQSQILDIWASTTSSWLMVVDFLDPQFNLKLIYYYSCPSLKQKFSLWKWRSLQGHVRRIADRNLLIHCRHEFKTFHISIVTEETPPEFSIYLNYIWIFN